MNMWSVVLIFLGSTILSVLLVYTCNRMEAFRWGRLINKAYKLPVEVSYKGQKVRVSCDKKEVTIPGWERSNGSAFVESVIIYINDIPALCVIRPFLGSASAYLTNEYKNEDIYPILKKINKAFNKKIIGEVKENMAEKKSFF